MQGILKKEYLEEQPFSPPSFVALVAIDLIAALFTFNAIAALLFVATRSWNKFFIVDSGNSVQMSNNLK